MVYGVSFDTQEENRAFSEKFDFNFPLLCDTDRAMGLAYGAASSADSAMAKRIGVGIDPEGKVHEYHSSVNAKSFPTEVVGRL